MDNLCDGTGFVWGSIYIVYGDGLFQFNQVKAAALGIVPVNELASCTTVNQTGDGLPFRSIHRFYFNL